MASLHWLFPDLTLTDDDKFLIELNSVFSTATFYSNGIANYPRYYKFNQRLPLEEVPQRDLSKPTPIRDAVENRALEILKKDKPINIFWSGGIDSTLMTCAFLEHAENKDQLTVYYTCESLKENPLFYDHIAKYNVKTVIWSDHWMDQFGTDDLVITGNGCDELTGSVDPSISDHYDVLLTPWKTFFHEKGFSHLIERCELLFASSHSPIVTAFDARWWFYFYIRHTFYTRLDWDLNLSNDFASNSLSFYNSTDLDAWSVHFKETIKGSSWKEYKIPLKQEIHRYWKNDDYLFNKVKLNSFVARMYEQKRVALLNQRYLFIYKNKDQYVRFSPAQMPFVSKQRVLEALNDLAN